MLCSASELGFGDDHSGIMILPPDAVPGVDSARRARDRGRRAVRPRGQSESARTRCQSPAWPATWPLVWACRSRCRRSRYREAGGDAASLASVAIIDPDLCGRFVARVLRGITIGDSPPWIASRLRRLGMRPINSVVDASNYVMLELGQPNHTYDLSKVTGGALRVRWARDGRAHRHARRRRPRADHRRRCDRRRRRRSPLASPASWAAPRPRSTTAPPRFCWRWRGGSRWRSPAARSASDCAARRRCASSGEPIPGSSSWRHNASRRSCLRRAVSSWRGTVDETGSLPAPPKVTRAHGAGQRVAGHRALDERHRRSSSSPSASLVSPPTPLTCSPCSCPAFGPTRGPRPT